jgi:hypothetical protein
LQLFGSLSDVSQVPSWLQSSKPVAQVVAVQVPVEHDSPEFGMSQAVLHPLQLVFERNDVSQPFSSFASQLPQAVSVQVAVQPVAPQPKVPCAFEHVSPHFVQLSVVPFVVSQPSALVQSKKPVLQV